RPKAERALMSAQRPLTAEAARWQPVQQATAGTCGAAERSGPPHGSEAWRSFPAGNHHLAAVTRSRSAIEPLGRSRAMPDWIWVLVVVVALFAVLIVVLRMVRRR